MIAIDRPVVEKNRKKKTARVAASRQAGSAISAGLFFLLGLSPFRWTVLINNKPLRPEEEKDAAAAKSEAAAEDSTENRFGSVRFAALVVDDSDDGRR